MLFDHYSLQDLSLNNRIVMPPMTRSRAGAGDVATDRWRSITPNAPAPV